MSIQQWGSELGKQVLEKLSTLYMKLVWESSALLTLCTPNIASQEDLSFATEDLARLTLKNIDKDGIKFVCYILLDYSNCGFYILKFVKKKSWINVLKSPSTKNIQR